MSAPEVSKVLKGFQNSVLKTSTPETGKKMHHEQYTSFQKNFRDKCNALKDHLKRFCNPFGRQECLVALDGHVVVDAEGVKELNALEAKGRELYENYVRERLIDVKKTVFTPLPSRVRVSIFSAKTKLSVDIDAKYFKSEADLFSRLLVIVLSRELDLDKFFKHENQFYPPALSIGGNIIPAKNKSDIVRILEEQLLDAASCINVEKCDALAYDGAPFVHTHSPKRSKKFDEYMECEFKQPIVQDKEKYKATRVDLVWDLYRECSLKNATREGRGSGTRRQVNFDDKITSFLK